ncbi:MAG: pseudouridine synthase [Candidatus Riflebacteria bacterium]|jgi:tRNA pseudouridine65 synthase|nr:pseudouridine synthase [Candidatus Riflebacteria bacterium]
MPNLTDNDIIFADEHLVVINKPAGLLVHPSYIDKNETESAMKQLRDLLGRWVFPVHRLDKPTSGILVFALSSEIAKVLTAAFTGREVQKTYLALVRGWAKEHDTIDYAIKDLWDKISDPEKLKLLPAREAITEYHRLAVTEVPVAVRPHPTSRYSLLRVTPHTGRNRQIRRHMKHIFHPVVGDHQHGDGYHNRMLAEYAGCRRLMLHAHSICFAHPVTSAKLLLVADPGQDFSDVLTRIGINTMETCAL